MLVDSKKGLLEVEPIIVIDAQETNEQDEIASAYAAALAEINMQGTNLFQEGNTLFIVHHAGSREGVVNILNADIIENCPNNYSEFIKTAYFFGYDILHCIFDEPNVLNIFENVKKNPPFNETDFEVIDNEEANELVLYLGPQRDREP